MFNKEIKIKIMIDYKAYFAIPQDINSKKVVVNILILDISSYKSNNSIKLEYI